MFTAKIITHDFFTSGEKKKKKNKPKKKKKKGVQGFPNEIPLPN